MSDVINIYVRGDNDGNYVGMTKEEILTAITQAISGGTVGDVDTGFVTKIKEQNRGVGLMFWVGTTAEYEAIEEKAENCLYIKTDDTSAADISDNFEQIFTDIANLQSGYAIKNHASASNEYGAGSVSQFGHLKITNESSTAGHRWEDSTYYSNRAVSGQDGKDFDTRIKQNASNIQTAAGNIQSLQEAVKVPVGSTIISEAPSETALPSYGYNYGTWVQVKTDSATVGGETYYMFYYYRTE